MSFEMNKFNVVKKKRLDKNSFVVECNVDVNAEIDKILSVSYFAKVENCEVLNGTINFAGGIDLCVLFSTVDGEIGSVNSSCPFTSKFENDEIKAGDNAFIKVEIEDCQVAGFTNGNIKLSCTCLQSGTIIMQREVQTIVSSDDDICCKEDEISINTFIGQGKEIFSVDTKTTIKEPIKKVVMSDSQVSIKSVDSGVNFVSVSGEVVTKILYLTQDDKFESCYTTESFKEEVELEGVGRESVCEAELSIKKSAEKCEVEEIDKGVNINLSVPVEIVVCAFEEKTQNVVKDIYSIKGDLEISTESFDMTKNFCGDYFETKIDGNLTLDENSPRVDKIMFVGASNLNITNAYTKNGEVFVEGISKTNVVYLNDETNSLYSVNIEVPFVVSDKTCADCENASVDVCATLFDVDVVVKKGREFYFDAKLKIKTTYDCNRIGAVISRAEQNSEYPEKDCAIELYFGQSGQSAWDIAKSLKIKEEMLYAQNPEVSFPLEKDENIVVFYQKRA